MLNHSIIPSCYCSGNWKYFSRAGPLDFLISLTIKHMHELGVDTCLVVRSIQLQSMQPCLPRVLRHATSSSQANFRVCYIFIHVTAETIATSYNNLCTNHQNFHHRYNMYSSFCKEATQSAYSGVFLTCDLLFPLLQSLVIIYSL